MYAADDAVVHEKVAVYVSPVGNGLYQCYAAAVLCHGGMGHECGHKNGYDGDECVFHNRVLLMNL